MPSKVGGRVVLGLFAKPSLYVVLALMDFNPHPLRRLTPPYSRSGSFFPLAI